MGSYVPVKEMSVNDILFFCELDMRIICLKGTVQSLTLTLSCFFCPHKISTDFLEVKNHDRL